MVLAWAISPSTQATKKAGAAPRPALSQQGTQAWVW